MNNNILVFSWCLLVTFSGCAVGVVGEDDGALPREFLTIDVEDRILTNSFEARGTRPLIVLLAEIDGADFELYEPEVYSNRFSNEHTRNVKDFFYQNSYGRFSIDFHGTYGPYKFSQDPAVDVLEENPEIDTAEVLIEATVRRFAEENTGLLESYDDNADGLLTQEELLLVVIDNKSLDYGAQRLAYFDLDDSFSMAMPAVILGADAILMTIAHEISHLLNTFDLYGANCNSGALTTLSCTLYPVGEYKHIHMDPWHKMRLGWVEPRMINMNDLENEDERSFCYELQAPQYTGGERNKQRPLLIYDSSRNHKEYFMVEFRNKYYHHPRHISYDDFGYNVGVVVWSVQVDENGEPVQLQSPNYPEMNDASIWTVSPNMNARRAFAWPEGSSIRPSWQDNMGANVVINVIEMSQDSNVATVCLSSIKNSY